MRQTGRKFQMARIEVKRATDGRPLARRTDGKPLTPKDREEARRRIEEEDPILTPQQWYLEFHRFHVEVGRSTPDLDWGWLRKDRPELYAAIKAIEDTIDGLGDARLSDVLSFMRRWRDLILQAESERQG